MKDAFYTYRYYSVDGQECPALYFDPLIIVGGDTQKDDPLNPNYCSRCDEHHYLPAKEYTFFHLKPLGERASRGDIEPLRSEMRALKEHVHASELHRHMEERYGSRHDADIHMNALKPGCLAEKALIYLFCEQNLLAEDLLVRLAYELELDRSYMTKVLDDNLRPVSFEQPLLTALD